ncbi:MAG: autotransporter domain-containing protein, partial [Deltaproteobacteria bacterium]|nr:autotransporter domain-containing protein [Deltaproteobacteria bacterium]
ATFDGTNLLVDVSLNDGLEVASAVFLGSNTLTLDSATIEAGVFTVIASDSVLATDTLAKWAISPVGNSRIETELTLASDNKALSLETSVKNLVLEWEGTNGTSWDYVAANFSGGETFIAGDQVVFDGSGQGQVLVETDVNAGKITFRQGDYDIRGTGRILATAGTGLAGSDGGFDVEAGTVRLSTNGAASIGGNAIVSGGELILNADFAVEGDFTLATGAKLAYEGSVIEGQAFSAKLTAANINILGILEARIQELSGLTYSTPFAINVGEATQSLALSSQNVSGEKAFYDYVFTKNGNNLILTVTPKGGDGSSLGQLLTEAAKGSASSSNMISSLTTAIGAGTGIEGELYDALSKAINAGSVAEAKQTLSMMTGETIVKGVEVSREVIVSNRAFLDGILGYEPMYVDYYPLSAGSSQDSWTAQAATSGRWGSGDGGGGGSGYDIRNFSGMIALYHRFDMMRVGGAISLGKTTVDFDDGSEKDSTDVAVTAFARYDNHDWFLSFEGFFGTSAADATRRASETAVATAEYDMKWTGFAILAGSSFDLENWRLTPRLGGTFTFLDFPGYKESGAGTLNQEVGGSSVKSFELETGVLIAREIDVNGSYVTPRLNLGVAYETQDETLRLETRFADQPGIPEYAVEAEGGSRLRGLVQAGADYAFSDYANLSLDYKGSFRQNDRIHSATLGLNYSW